MDTEGRQHIFAVDDELLKARKYDNLANHSVWALAVQMELVFQERERKLSHSKYCYLLAGNLI
ncbi:hypothetical protein A2U01_0049319, partial [Trifolium medium]|nr:hypothetical protein [Trifolium medium]